MRLLDTKTLELHEFFGANIPPYAILSHTWGQDEVSLQEMQSRNAESKAGYDKILRCCEMAAAAGFHYAWVDTCCIDKTSSAELSEAINSMYQWYRLSEVCYVYLSDVPANLGKDAAFNAFQKSRWFTRGWTLQELIAPPSVIFFNAKWEDLGTKQSLKAQIMKITAIQAEVLEDSERRCDLSIAQKMSWASKRKTTRVEDIAYCLLGIFVIHMPLLYGEGNHAFIRLQEEIMRKTNDHSIFAWYSTGNIHRKVDGGLLANSPAKFSDSGEIIQSRGQDTSPFSLTNKGIHLCLQASGLNNAGLFLAVLDCQKGANEGNRVGIYLEAEPGGADIFRKVSVGGLASVDVTGKRKLKLKRQDFFVKQERAIEKIARYSSHYVSIDGLEAHGIILQDSYPATVKGNGLSKLSERTPWDPEPLNALRFSDKDGDRFIVVVKSEWERSSLTSNIFETGEFFALANPPVPSTAPLSIMRDLWGVDNEWNWNRSERVIWQHPLKKWRISLMTKRSIENGERRETVHIRWHIPEEEGPEF
jgi:hypothetical protein